MASSFFVIPFPLFASKFLFIILMYDSAGRKDEDDAKVEKVDDGKEIKSGYGDRGDKVNFTHGFTPHQGCQFHSGLTF